MASISTEKRKQQQRQQQQQQQQQQELNDNSNILKHVDNIDILQQCIKVLNYLVSFQETGPFTIPVPKTATLYHNKIKKPMDFFTLEQRILRQKYHSFQQFEDDLNLIWNNAILFNDPGDSIYKKAVYLKQQYLNMDSIIKKEMASIPYIPVELLSIHPTITDYATDRTLYFTHVVLPQQAQWMVKKFRGYNSARTLYNEISAPLYQWLQDPETAINQDLPYPRLYISKNRTYIKEAADHSSSSCFVLIWDVEITDAPSTLKRDDIFLLTTNVTLGYPFSESINMFNPPPISQPDASNDILPKAYVKFLPLKTHYKVKCLISKQMESTFLRRPHVTHRVIANQNINGTVDEFLTRQMVHSLWTGEHHLDLPEIYSISDTNTTTHKKEKSSISSTSSTSSPTTAKSYQASHLASNHSASHPASNHSASTTTTLFTPSDTKKEQISRTVNNQIPSLSSPTSSSDVKTLENLTTGMNGDRSQMITKTAVPSAEEEEQFENSLRIYRERCNTLFDDLKKYAKSVGVQVVNVKKYLEHTTPHANAEGYFKQVRYVENNKDVVVQTFRRMTASQRVIEIISLLKVKGFPHMAEILEVLHADDDEGQEVIGLSMRRYQRTLKQYTHSHSHHRLTAHQKLDIIRQMLHCIESIHDVGIAHRDLSEVNFMVDELDNDPRLPDGSTAAHVYLIDFGKAIFTTPEDARRWWIAPVPKQYQQQLLLKAQGSISTSTSSSTTTTAASSPTPISPSGGSPSADLTTMTLPGHEYDGEVIPETKEDLDTWCERLPLVYLKPDHGYRHYRSIQTLPRNRTDHAILPWLVDPMAEDMYSMGTLMWKIFAETEPWHGILDTDLRQLRETVEEDEKIEIRVKREIAGDLSQQLVLFCLKTQPEERATATDLLAWLDQPNITKGLLEEWTVHAPTERKKRHAKSAFEFEEEQARHSLASARNRKAAKKKKQLQQQQYEQEQRKAERERVKLEKEKQKQQEKLQLQPSMIYPQPPPPPPVYYYPPFPFYSMQNTSSMSSPLQQQQQQPSISSAPFNSYQPAPPPPQHSAFRNLRFTMPMTPNGPATTSNKPTSPMIVDSHPDTTSFLPPDKWIQDPSMYPLSNVRTEMQGPAESQSPPRRVFYQQKLRWMYNSTSKLGFTTGKETTADSTTVSTIKTTTNQSSISMESISKQQQEETTTSSGSSSSSSKSGYVKTGKPLGRPKGSISKRKRRQQQYHRHRQEKSNQTSIVEMSSPTEQQS